MNKSLLSISFLILTASHVYAGAGDPNDVQLQPECGPLVHVAGTGAFGVFGNGGPATNAAVSNIEALAIDKAGNLYIGHYAAEHQVIRKVDTNGVISTFAGTAPAGSSGDGGPATAASFKGIKDLVFNEEGDLFVADRSADNIRKIDSNGLISTVISLPYATSPTGVAVDPEGRLYVSSATTRQVWKVEADGASTIVAGNGSDGFSGDGGPAVDAALSWPWRITFDQGGNLYIPDSQNHRVRKIGKNGVITTVAGDGTPESTGDGGPAVNAQLEYPNGIVIDQTERIFIVDGYHTIRTIDQGMIKTAPITAPLGSSGSPVTLGDLTIDKDDNLYIAAYNKVWKTSCSKPSEDAKIRKLVPKKAQGFVHPSQPPEKRIPPGILERKAGGPPILKKAAPAERTVAKPSLLQKIKAFFSR